MPIYEFKCPRCGNIKEEYASIKDGPPELVLCKLCFEEPQCHGIFMERVYSCNFVLKGENWPGKEAKAFDRKMAKSREQDEEQENERRHLATNAQQVIKERRKGRASFKEYKKKNPDKVKDYAKALGQGIKPE